MTMNELPNDELYQEDDLAPPTIAEVGQTAPWTLPLDNFTDGAVEELTGRFIGFGSSHRDGHINHNGAEYVPPKTVCSACRWFEARIFKGNDGRYFLHTVGETILPGEEPRYKGDWHLSPYEIIDSLTTYRPTGVGTERKATLSFAARRALAQAAHFDPQMDRALTHRLERL